MFALEVTVRSFPKAGHTATQNEDAIATDLPQGRLAIADGASEGWQSGNWANRIAAAFVDTPPSPDTFVKWLTDLRPQITGSVGGSWYVETKSLQGSFSTLLGLTFETAKNGGIKWRAFAVGDCCLFHYRKNQLLTSFPLESSGEFNSVPALIGSATHVAMPEPIWFAGRAELGDRFFLLTDALAEWFLKQVELGHHPEHDLTITMSSSERMESWLRTAREKKGIRNDDTTVALVQIVGP